MDTRFHFIKLFVLRGREVEITGIGLLSRECRLDAQDERDQFASTDGINMKRQVFRESASYLGWEKTS